MQPKSRDLISEYDAILASIEEIQDNRQVSTVFRMLDRYHEEFCTETRRLLWIFPYTVNNYAARGLYARMDHELQLKMRSLK